jgi:hypothetical protein
MNRRVFQFAIVLLWLALPLLVLEYRAAWESLPAQMATHFSPANQPIGWMSREEALRFGLILMAGALGVSTGVLIAATRRKIDAFSWTLLAFFAFFVGFLFRVNQAVLRQNLGEGSLHPQHILWAMPVAVVGLLFVYFFSQRRAPLPAGQTLAVETHAGGGWSFVILLSIIGPVIAVSLVPGGPQWPLLLVALMGLGVFAMVAKGFQYRFLSQGVEIWTLGFRLRSIPRQDILGYAIEAWPVFRGRGIRGMGDTRAYVWGNKVVHIRLSNGDVYLGHDYPDRLIHDLDRVTGFVTRG